MKFKVLPVVAMAGLALAGCSQGDDSSDSSSSSSPSPSTSSSTAAPSSSSPSVAPTGSPSASSSDAPDETSSDGPTENSVPSAEPSQQPADDSAQPGADAAGASPQLAQYLHNGGGCISDVWNDSAAPYSEALHNELVQYCSANQLGDWAGGADPMNPESYGTPEDQAEVRSNEQDIERCKAADPETAPSGQIQYCFMEYGIRIE